MDFFTFFMGLLVAGFMYDITEDVLYIMGQRNDSQLEKDIKLVQESCKKRVR